MMTDFKDQYHRDKLYQTIIAALERQGASLSSMKSSDLWPVDQFHIGGAGITKSLGKIAGIGKRARVLDVGSGLGGPARQLAEEFGCTVKGIDLTRAYVETSNKLSQLLGLQNRTQFQIADALYLPFENASFEVVWTQHVQMNIPDKAALYQELKRVLVPGGQLIYYDIFKGTHQPVIYPTPWSDNGANSYLFKVSELLQILTDLGFRAVYQKNDSEFGISYFRDQMNKAPQEKKPLLSLHLLMGETAAQKLHNVYQNLMTAAIELHSGIFIKEC